jgi:UDP-N-acetylglucosamine 2-epimerase (non-hydrolysing)
LKRIISVVGARPNFMKVAPIHRAFLERPTEFDHQIVHTGQHYDASMSDAFFHDLDMPYPQWFLGVGSGSHAQQTARIISAFEEVCVEARPDYVIVVGDVNSTIACALTSVKIGIRTAHIESGLRSFDRSMPEEINRLATDAIVNDLFVTEPSGMHNLHHEGVEAERIHFVGNTMIDSLHYALDRAQDSDVLSRLNVIPQEYALVTLHRPSNVDFEARLTMLMSTLAAIASDTTLVFPVIVIDPVGYIDFVTLMRDAAFTLTDSGGIQEETTALGVPCITARTSTERPSTTDIGTNVLVLPERQPILDAVNDIRNGKRRQGRVPELWDGRAALRIVEVISRKLS